jgi:AbiV family abortive infection protein
MWTAGTLREAAAAALDNSRRLYADAVLLRDHDRGASAVALARIGVEEFGKAIALTVAALKPAEQAALTWLNVHGPKRFAAEMVEGTLCMFADGWAAEQDDCPYPIAWEERMLDVIVDLARSGLRSVLPTAKEAKAFDAWVPEGLGLMPGDLAPMRLKDAALYVDVSDTGDVLTPEHVAERATSEVLELDYYLKRFGALHDVLMDDVRWQTLAARVH